jgi:hypothetical protein
MGCKRFIEVNAPQKGVFNGIPSRLILNTYSAKIQGVSRCKTVQVVFIALIVPILLAGEMF